MVPDYEHLHDAYELLWEMPGNDGYLQLVGIMQKFIDQSISANTNYDPSRFPSGKVPMQQLLERPAHRLQIRGQNTVLSEHP
ncbi:ribonucleoside-diphosphate reductase [Escherichia coli]|uniref:Ribonucleoside-diphosphate reductase n=1 Tax=Escherichia coli TaxID=562 RepID=A0A377CWZ4_ECOLX|nr:ribonucleoside-diphosphate reductase [Escherichia coli]